MPYTLFHLLQEIHIFVILHNQKEKYIENKSCVSMSSSSPCTTLFSMFYNTSCFTVFSPCLSWLFIFDKSCPLLTC
jgi:hypothetical protein